MKNPISKNMNKVNKASTHRDKKNDYNRAEDKEVLHATLDEAIDAELEDYLKSFEFVVDDAIKKGLQESKEGKLKDLGSFVKYADEDKDDE